MKETLLLSLLLVSSMSRYCCAFIQKIPTDLYFENSTVSLTGHYIPGQPSLIEETYNMLEDQDPMDQEYLDGFGMHHFGIGPTDAEDKNLRDEESSELEKTEKYAQSIVDFQ